MLYGVSSIALNEYAIIKNEVKLMDKIKKKHVGAPLGNQYAVGNNGGRPPKYSNVEEMQVLIDAYFDECKEDGRPLTISGLAYVLDLTRQGLIEYTAKQEFSDTIFRAKKKIESFAEESLWTVKNASGVMFSLKNNYKWKDKHEIEQSITIDTAGAISAARERAKLLRDE